MADERNPPAFPRDHRHNGHNGMDLRDWFAGQALTGLVVGRPGKVTVFASEAYLIADAMLAERERQP